MEAALGLSDKAQTQSVIPRPVKCEGRTLLGADKFIFRLPAVVVCLLAHTDVFFLHMFVAEHTCSVVFRMVSDWMSPLAIETNKMCQPVLISFPDTTPYRSLVCGAQSLTAPQPGGGGLSKKTR